MVRTKTQAQRVLEMFEGCSVTETHKTFDGNREEIQYGDETLKIGDEVEFETTLRAKVVSIDEKSDTWLGLEIIRHPDSPHKKIGDYVELPIHMIEKV